MDEPVPPADVDAAAFLVATRIHTSSSSVRKGPAHRPFGQVLQAGRLMTPFPPTRKTPDGRWTSMNEISSSAVVVLLAITAIVTWMSSPAFAAVVAR